jgi:hypothetical protein
MLWMNVTCKEMISVVTCGETEKIEKLFKLRISEIDRLIMELLTCEQKNLLSLLMKLGMGKIQNINNHIDNLEPEKIAVCSVVKAELFYGSMKSNNPKKNLNLQKSFLSQFVSLPFDDSCAEIYCHRFVIYPIIYGDRLTITLGVIQCNQ